MRGHVFKKKIFVFAVLLFAILSYMQNIKDIVSYPEKISTKIIDFPCNNITMNLTNYDDSLRTAAKELPTTGVIGYYSKCYNVDYNNVNTLTEIDYNCLTEIYAAQYALAPLVMIRSDNPSIIIFE
jgi:hypothetical protein